MTASASTSCEAPDANVFNNVFMGVLGFVVFLSYGPMIHAVVKARSSKGVALGSMLLVAVTNFLNATGVAIQNWQSLICCNTEWDSVTCLEGVNPVLLVGECFAGIFPMLCVTVYFYQTPVSTEDGGEQKTDSDPEDPPNLTPSVSESNSTVTSLVSSINTQQHLRKLDNESIPTGFDAITRGSAIRCLLAYFALQASIVTASALLLIRYGPGSKEADTFADTLNIIAGATMAFSWIPQIFHTFAAKDPGNLSVLTIALQVPGAAAIVTVMLLDSQGITAVVPNATACICQLALLILCIKYVYIDPRSRQAAYAPVSEKATKGKVSVALL